MQVLTIVLFSFFFVYRYLVLVLQNGVCLNYNNLKYIRRCSGNMALCVVSSSRSLLLHEQLKEECSSIRKIKNNLKLVLVYLVSITVLYLDRYFL